ncbi:MAG: type II-A CRISPR-associated protein Csn2 [Lachnospiraceae bacterium]
MRLYFQSSDCALELKEGKVQGVCIESPMIMKTMARDLWDSFRGKDVPVFLTDQEKALKVSKEVAIIWHPCLIDVNERKIISKLYQEMQEVVEEELSIEKSSLNSAIVNFLDSVVELMPYPISFSLDIDIQALFKDYSIKIDVDGEGMLEDIIDYIKLSHQISKNRLYVFFHLCSYLNKEEIEQLSEAVKYEGVTVLMIEGHLPEEKTVEEWLIIDQDQCMIRL